MEDIIVVGSSGHAKLVIDTVEKEGKYRIVGLISRDSPKGIYSYGYRILGKEEDLPDLAKKRQVRAGIVAIGDNWVRAKVVERIRKAMPEFSFVSAVHPSAQLARGVGIGAGTVILAASSVNGDARIGDCCVVSTRVSFDHDSILEDYASLAPGVTIGGNVHIGRFSAVCLGANVIHSITIGEHSVVGAGATVVSDLPAHVVSYGTPAKIIRKREPGEQYL